MSESLNSAPVLVEMEQSQSRWGRLLPLLPSPSHRPVDLLAGQSEYWLGRSSSGCDIPLPVGVGLNEKQKNMMKWAHSKISNRHCKISIVSNEQTTNSQLSSPSDSSTNTQQLQPSMQVVLEDCSTWGTIVNESIYLRKGERLVLNKGDKICLVTPETLRKRVKNNYVMILHTILQQYTYIFMPTEIRQHSETCLNRRHMNEIRALNAACLASHRSIHTRLDENNLRLQRIEDKMARMESLLSSVLQTLRQSQPAEAERRSESSVVEQFPKENDLNTRKRKSDHR